MHGRVFNDFNTNGLFDTDGNAGAVDVPVGGLTIQGFTGTDTLVATAVTGADGRYTLNLPDARVRLELGVVRPWWPTRQLSGLRSDVQFVDASSPRIGVNFGVHRLSEFSIDNPILFWPTQWAGPPVSSNPNANQVAIRGAPYFSKRPAGQVQSWNDLPNKVQRATFEQVGTVFGLAMNQRTADLYAGAFQKRLAGLKDGPGAIFRITPQRQVSVFATLNAGDDPHPTSSDINDWINCAGATVGSHPRCDFSWTEVGKIGLGSVVIDTVDQNLYTVNLFDKTLDRLPLAVSRRVRRPRQAANPTPIPDPGCANGDDWRPFSAAFDRVNRKLYVGGVCSAQTSQDRANLRGVVYRVDHPTSAPIFIKVLDFPLNWARTSSTSGMTSCGAPNLCGWNPWPRVTPASRAPTSTNSGTITENNNPAFPQLTAITFAQDGTMILGMRDMIGDMGGVNVPGEIGAGGQSGLGPMLHGDMLRAGANPDGTFSLESGGVVAGITSAGQSANNWGYGPGIGPGGGYFYNPAPLASGLHNYPYPTQGGVTQIPGFPEVVATSIHIRDPQENGLLWRDNNTGDTKEALQNFVTPDSSNFTGFAKSNGLGDIDAFTGLAPVQIGNRLWYDLNRDGIQDADEPPVTDTVVELVDCHRRVVGSTRTDSVGEYVFPITAGTCYTVRVPLDQPSLHGWVPTQAFAGNQRRLDSNGRAVNGRSVGVVIPHGTGQNDHSYDFGFHRPPPIPPQPPTPPVPEPPPPPEVSVAGSVSQRLELIKQVASRSGGTVRYTMVVRNGGAQSMARVRVCDQLPASLVFRSGTMSGRRVVGRLVCWSFSSLSSGEERTLHLTTRAGAAIPAGGVVNCARATARDAPPQRACATVRGPRRPAFTG